MYLYVLTFVTIDSPMRKKMKQNPARNTILRLLDFLMNANSSVKEEKKHSMMENCTQGRS